MKITKNHTLIPIEGALNTSANRSVTASIGMYSDFQKCLTAQNLLKLGYSEKATKFEKIFHFKLDVTE